jgi:hypothetical protein
MITSAPSGNKAGLPTSLSVFVVGDAEVREFRLSMNSSKEPLAASSLSFH